MPHGFASLLMFNFSRKKNLSVSVYILLIPAAQEAGCRYRIK